MSKQIKILYVCHRYDPRDINQGSSSDYFFCKALREHEPFEINFLGPSVDEANRVERYLRRLYSRISGKNNIKFPFSLAYKQANALIQAEAKLKPDIIFTLFASSLIFYKGQTPCIYRIDSVQYGLRESADFGNGMLHLGIWQDKQAVKKCSRIITHSDWNRNFIVDQYGFDFDRVNIFPIPASFPHKIEITDKEILEHKHINKPLRLLFVGRVKERKGFDIALEVVDQLNDQGYPATLTICGLEGENQPHVEYTGLLNKSNPAELQDYLNLYKNAHLLLHPARFEPAGMAPSEAAAFGTPTITNRTGGLSTTVTDCESGYLLPKNSPAKLYVKKIIDTISDKQRYYDLCLSARRRYERELNWDVASKRVIDTVYDAIQDR